MKFIGEIGINHNGELKNALKIVEKFNFLDILKSCLLLSAILHSKLCQQTPRELSCID